jgi:hypothetical protein
MEYSNPRMEATVGNWPTGSLRTTAHFWIESHPKHGQRGMRTTDHPKTGKPSAHKALTFARQARIVDGDDGRTYIACLSSFGFVSIMRGDMKFQHEVIHESDPRYPAVRALFNGEAA